MFLQSLDLQECTVPHLKDLIHICLKLEAQGCDMTFNKFYVGTPISYHTEANGCIFFAAVVRWILVTALSILLNIFFPHRLNVKPAWNTVT